jgi:glycerol transport system ATP-binding protein
MSFMFGSIPMKARLHEDQKVPVKNARVSFPEQWLKVYVDEYLLELTHE